MRYVDFSIKLQLDQAGAYRVTVLHSPSGVSQGVFRIPFDDDQMEALIQDFGSAVRSSRDRHLLSSPTSSNVVINPRQIGQKLFEALFQDQLLSLFHRSLGSVEGEAERGLRLKLHFDPGSPDMAKVMRLPWEFLYWQSQREFLGLNKKTPLVRFLEVPRPVRSLDFESPLRVLAALSSPKGYPELDLGREQARIEKALSKVEHIEVKFLESATLKALHARLVGERFHVLHYMGHGGFDEQTGEGSLLLEDDFGNAHAVSGQALADTLRNFYSLRLVVLNACDTARSSCLERFDPFAGVATALLMAGLPAVLAMQYPFSDRAAVAFSTTFYKRLAAGDPVDAATAEGRTAIYAENIDSLEWGTPVLFLRAPDGCLFDSPPQLTKGWEDESRSLLKSQVIDYRRFIAEKTEGFVGREWIFDAIRRFTEEESRGYFVISGDPGIGKSALIAQLVKQERYIHHFNIRPDGIQRPETFLENTCAQLILEYGLDYPTLPPEATQDSRFLRSLLEKASVARSPGSKVLLLVDALDETDSTTLSPGANTLYLPARLPERVFMVLTARRGGYRLRTECPLRPLDIEQDSEGNIADIQQFIEGWLDRQGIQEYISGLGMEGKTFVAEMVGRSQGNFMYLRYVMPEIDSGRYQSREFETLPIGLENYYEDLWQHMRSSNEKAWVDYELPILVALQAVKEPISIDLIADFTSVDSRTQIRAVLDRWKQFLYEAKVDDEEEGPQKRYRLYHASFTDFIAAKDEVEGEYVDLKKTHAAIADSLWRDLYGEDEVRPTEE